jgi:hypothetical protein
VRFGSQDFGPDYRTSGLLVRDLDHDGRLEAIVLATHIPYSPSVAVLLDGSTGEVRGQYWHWGYLSAVLAFDVDGDGLDEVYLGGQNNAYGLASLAVLGLRAFDGHGPVPDSLRPQMKAANHRAYLLFPRSPLAEFSSELRNSVSSVIPGANGQVVVDVSEYLPDRPVSLHFVFDGSFRSARVVVTDYFRTVAQQLVRNGRLAQGRAEEFVTGLEGAVLFWDGKRFRESVDIASEMGNEPMARGGAKK